MADSRPHAAFLLTQLAATSSRPFNTHVNDPRVLEMRPRPAAWCKAKSVPARGDFGQV